MSSGCGDVLSLQDLKNAKIHQTFEAEVITGLSGGIAGGAGIDYATNPLTGQTQKTLPAVLRDAGYTPASFDFSTGGTIPVNGRQYAVLWPLSAGGDGDYYYWEGALPKVIPAASTPASTGGVVDGAWRPVGDIALRTQLISSADNLGDALITVKQPLTGSVARTLHARNRDTVYLEDFGAVGNGTTDDTAAIQAALNSGASLITKTSSGKKFYKITDTLLMKTDNQTLDLANSEIDNNIAALNKPSIIIGNTTQMNGPKLKNIAFTSKGMNTAYLVQINNVGGFVVEGCVGYGYSGNRAQGFIEINRAVVGYIRKNTTQGLVDSSLWLKGTGNGADRCIDVAVYDNRFEQGLHAARYGDYCEGIFFRRNICYAHTSWHLVLEASTPTTGLFSGKIQENDFDSPMTTNGGIYMQNYKNVQITDNWFAIPSSDPNIRLESGTDSVIITGNQAYPGSAFLLDNGRNTVTTANMIIGGTTQIYFGANATLTTVADNHMTAASATCIDTNGHVGTLTVSSNNLQAAGVNGGLTSPVAPPAGHRYVNNIGDTQVGSGVAVTMTASPYTYTVGARPVILGLKGGTVTSVSVNSNQMATASNITLGPLPPGSVVQIAYTGAVPGLQVLRVL